MSDNQSKSVVGGQTTTTSSHNVIDDLINPTPSINTLPTASSLYKGHTVIVPGNGTTTADIFYICLMSSTGTYTWKQIVTG